ncbi:hypothetical protein BO94DRAFT_227624 [Aspergillus sclerotioniger CBS 115572]|uniref:Zn(2)-C6 fungal-type domain-containing protein n=1 Tax=Aspergillus sclerotioniger CBS 115572 TaxID=1450535 RepID=A0A317VMP8_9EURO|nr:hypothetical protein BO94DRAFT_227624 [Aspergillus sclerotioniger CBS 115572]PWY74501.1 hypothetical protein BO94DRAFT_227624 [Aspergillus sclerotioniger CBS 115572]
MTKHRKPHAKSRHGCLQCKERHTKCDEFHPQCMQCRRQQISCSFSSPNLAVMPLNEDSLADLELLEYWHRYPLIPGMPQQAKHLEHGYVQLGFSHHYLLNSILSLAALQRFNGDRSCTRWYLRAVAHQQAAISRVKPHLQGLETSTSHHKAVLAFSTFTSLYAVTEPLLRLKRVGCGSSPNFDPVAEFIRVIQIGRSTSIFVQQHLSSLIHMDPFMASKFSSHQLAYAGDLEARFPQLGLVQSFIEQYPDENEHKAVCLHAAKLVFTYMAVFFDSMQGQRQTRVIFAWVNEVQNPFLDLCSRRHPLALAILAHFAALMSLNRGAWFTQSWSQLLLEDIRYTLDGWEDIIQWPMGIVMQSDVTTI